MSTMLRMSEDQVRKHMARINKNLPPPRVVKPMGEDDLPANKYKNRKAKEDGITFASEKERRRYIELKLLEKAGQIRNLELQKRFELAPGCELYGKKIPPIRYFSDFYYEGKTAAGWRVVVEDTKGYKTGIYLTKRHLMKTVLGIQILET